MPNWVHNKVKFKSRGEEIINKVVYINNDKEELGEEDVKFDFERIIPMPKELHITSGSIEDYAVQYALIRTNNREELVDTLKKLEDTKVSFDGNYLRKFYRIKKYTLEELEEENKRFIKFIENKEYEDDDFNDVDYVGLGIHNLEDFGKLYINNVIKYGADTWYDWHCKNWGCKWNATRTYVISDDEVEFETPWSCPVEVLKELSRQFSGVEIYVEYADEDYGSNCGYFTLLNGEFDEFVDMDGDTDFALRVQGYGEDEIEEYYKEMAEYEEEE